MMKKIILLLAVSALMCSSCTENYSNGERIGFITKFSRKGLFFKSWEGEMNITQTGMNTSSTFDFSVDNNHEPPIVVSMLDSAANQGWKVKLKYHEVWGKNLTGSRGETDHFITDLIILDRHPISFMNDTGHRSAGRVVDTVYLVIYKDKK